VTFFKPEPEPWS